MTQRIRPPVFLERKSYRKRRMMDALRLLPIFGALLFMLPLFWPTPDDGSGGVRTWVALIYIFSAWSVLIVIAGALYFILGRELTYSAPQDD